MATMLLAEFHKQGIDSAYMIPEFAKYHLACGGTIKDFPSQRFVGYSQMALEAAVDRSSFNPIICDTCVWLGKVYTEFAGYYGHNDLPSYLKDIDQYTYDMTIFCPLPDADGVMTDLRIHDGSQSAKIAFMIMQELKDRENVIYAPVRFEDRDVWIKQLVKEWRDKNARK